MYLCLHFCLHCLRQIACLKSANCQFPCPSHQHSCACSPPSLLRPDAASQVRSNILFACVQEAEVKQQQANEQAAAADATSASLQVHLLCLFLLPCWFFHVAHASKCDLGGVHLIQNLAS